ncbi:MAG TPA: M14 family metallopeptidase [Saprospiraceae bacterium]|nr:M14 family metallopeptidase [Saprospiraceae bacterium]HMP25998.1 M14 family metallopeptidase [Saprospiraceae bacterium]
MQRLIFATFFLLTSILSFAQLKSPDEFFPHRWGAHFTPHHLLVNYYEHAAANSNYVKLERFGYTNEMRPQLLLIVSAPENLARIEAIRENNLRRTGLLSGQPQPEEIAFVWLGFSVHGNETAGAEAAPQVLYELLDPNKAETKAWLKNTVVLIEPVVNPDGFNRYVEWYRRTANVVNNPYPSAMEHLEPWPGGRVNHYLFDLNRDWAWQSQKESQQRVKVYQQWLPHIVADLHEQGVNEPYYFAPAAQPFHKYITQWQRDFQVDIGKNHAKYFDAEGWLYFTKERFDLLYPSYGDTYPTYTGAIGMTYEQGGSGRAGRGIIDESGDTLTLLDRVLHHKATALSTVEVSSKNAARIVSNFSDFYVKSRNAQIGEYKTFVIKGTNVPERMRALCELLDKNKIRYGKAGRPGQLRAWNYQTGREITLKVEDNDLIISAFQPMSVLAQILLEPQTALVDSLTYDITAWSLPYAYGLETYASKERFEPQGDYTFPPYSNKLAAVREPYAFIARWNALQNARFLGALLQKGVKVRFAREAFTVEGQPWSAGSLVILAADNRKMPGYEKIVAETAETFRQEIQAVRTGFVSSGKDFGSDAYTFINVPKVALLGGEGTYANSFGQTWHFFEQDLGYPVTVVPAGNLARINLDDFNVLIMPDGFYNLNDAFSDKLQTWLNGGGRLIALGSALRSLEDRRGFNLTRYASDDDKNAAKKAGEKAELDARFDSYDGQERRYIMEEIPGAIFQLKMDRSHPLAYGIGDTYYSLKTGATAYQPLKGAWNVGTIGESPMYVGFVGTKALQEVKNSVVFAVQDKGRGSITYMVDNPLFRSFWEQGKFLFSNALFFSAR